MGEHARLVGELEALVAEQPLRERPQALLMRALYGAGRQAEALAADQRARRVLAEQARRLRGSCRSIRSCAVWPARGTGL